MEIIPVINCESLEDALERANEVASMFRFSSLPRNSAHIDISDGKYANTKTISEPADLKEISEILKDVTLEVHLMALHAEDMTEEWLSAGASRVIIHPDACDEVKVLSLIKKLPGKITLSLRPELPVEALLFFKEYLERIHILAVKPGPSSQNSEPRSIEKISELKRRFNNVWVELDGGVNLSMITELREQGLDAACVSSALFSSPDPIATYQELVSKAEK